MGLTSMIRSGFEKTKEGTKGLIDKTKADIKEKYEISVAERKADIYAKKVAKSEARQIRRVSRAEDIKKTAKYKAELKGETARERMAERKKSGFLFGRKIDVEPARQEIKKKVVGKRINYGRSSRRFSSAKLNIGYLNDSEKSDKPKKRMGLI